MYLIWYMLISLAVSALTGIYICFYKSYAEKQLAKENVLKAQAEQPEASEEEQQSVNVKQPSLQERWSLKACWRDGTLVRVSLLAGVINLLLSFVVYHFMSANALLAQVKWLAMLWLLLPVALIDFKMKLIPNHVLWVMLVARLVFFALELRNAGEYQSFLITSVAVGAVIGGGIMLIVHAISRGGLGWGDVKLFALLGFYAGSSNMLQLLVYCFLLSSLTGIGMLIFKKAHLQDQMPLAPFAFLGAVLACVFLNY